MLDGIKPSILMGKLKQLHPHGVSHNNDLFLSMFFKRLPLSMRETIGAGTHKTAMVTVKAVDTLWDARGGNNQPVAAAMTRHSRSPTPARGKKGKKRGCSAQSQSRPSSP
jgi:hypothetical protein